MRLTLRTLLAYMDGTLSPEDTEVLGAKIKESKFATDLMQRIESASKQLRLGAPKPDAKGANDPNLVADYLDGTLSEERVVAFERVCLDSDLNLSEVAACLTILMLVLGEPADVSPGLRKRIYALTDDAADAIEAPPVQSDSAEAPPKTALKSEESSAPEVEDDELDERIPLPRERRLAPLAITAVVALLALLALMRLWAPLNSSHPAVAFLFGEPAEQGQPPAGGDPLVNEGGDPTPADATGSGGDADPSEDSSGDGDATSGEPAETGAETPSDDGTAGESSSEAGAGADGSDASAGGEAGDASQPPTETGEPAEPGAAPPRDGDATTGDAAAGAPTPEPTPPTGATPDGGDTPTIPGTAPPAISPGGATDVEAVRRGPEFGRFITTQQLLFRREPSDGTWLRVGAAEMLRVGDGVACPPSFRPSIGMVNGVQLIFAGASNATLLDRNEDDLPTIRLERGRVVLVTSGRAGAAVRLTVAGRMATITFGDAESSVAIEVRDFLPPGADASAREARKVIEAYPLGGTIIWSEASGDLSLGDGQVMAALDDETGVVYIAETTPEWTDLRVSSGGFAPAAQTLEPAITEGRPVSLSLQEKVGFRQQDTVALSIDSLAQIGIVDAAVQSLDNERQHAYWALHVAALRDEIARGPEHADATLDKLVAFDAEHGEKMFDLLVGYDAAQLADGKAAELVAALEHEKMPVRVLAYQNLRQITGRSNFYQAQKNAERQRDKIRYWKDLLEKNQIAYPVPPSPLPVRKPVE